MTDERRHSSSDTAPAFEGFAILELFGHRKLAGLLSVADIASTSFIRIEIFLGDDHEPTATEFYNPTAVYAIKPSSEELCRAYAARGVERPVQRWELPAPETAVVLPGVTGGFGPEPDEQDVWAEDRD